VRARPAAGQAAPPAPAPAAVRRARLAVFWVFCLCGVIASLWSTSLPTINARLHLGETRLGFVLLMTGAGAVAVMPLTGRLCDRLGSRWVLRAGAPLSAITLIGPALARSFPVLLATAFLLGGGIGSLDVGMNAHAIVVERRYGRSIMSAFHGFWSVGGVLGSAVIATGLHLRVSDPPLMIGGAIATALLLIAPGRLLLPRHQEAPPGGRAGGHRPGEQAAPGSTPGGQAAAIASAEPAPDSLPGGQAAAIASAEPAPGSTPGGQAAGIAPRKPAAAGIGSGEPAAGIASRHAVVLLLGIVVLAGFICEGAAYNWAPLHAIRELHAAPATAALAYTVFATALMIGRLTGDRLHRRLGPVRAIGWAGGIAVCGYLLVLLAPSLPAGRLACDYAGWAVTGLGLATVVPAVFSAVGALERGVGRTLSRVVAFGYAGELAGPAVIGPLAGATSLRVAMLVPAGLAALIAVLGPVAVIRATVHQPQ
jgi:MFS family permease